MKNVLTDKNLKENHPELIPAMKVALEYLSNYYKENAYYPRKYINHFDDLEQEHKNLLDFDYKERYNKIDECFKDNQAVLMKLVKYYKDNYLSEDKEPATENDRKVSNVGPINYHACWFLVRDWTKEGENIRKEQYGPILDVVNKYFISNKTADEIKNTKFLVPGAGLCRLVYELALKGINVEANDYSFINLLIDNYFFNVMPQENVGHFHPMCHSFTCLLNSEGPSKKYVFPDVNIRKSLGENNVENLTLIYGDFAKIYKQKPSTFDCLITVFFLDSARNIIDWLQTIYNTLKKGGIWINFGPLDYESANSYYEPCIELTWEDVKAVMLKLGFEFLNLEFRPHAYCHIEGEIRKSVYDCIFFTAMKK